LLHRFVLLSTFLSAIAGSNLSAQSTGLPFIDGFESGFIDSNGNGIPDSIDAIARFEWQVISTNTLADVDPCPTRDCPYSAVEGQSGVLNDWTGGIFASRVGELGSLVYWGGGHNGYYGTEVYAFDLALLRWRRLSEPTLGTDPANPRDFGLDAECRFHDGAPVTMHTYDSVEYDPLQNRFWLTSVGDSPSPLPGPPTDCNSRIPAYFDFDDGAWRSGSAELPEGAHRFSATAWDPNRQRIWLHGTQGRGWLISFDPVSGQSESFSRDGGWVDIDPNGDIDPLRDLFVIADFRAGAGIRVRDLAQPLNNSVFPPTVGDTEIETLGKAGFAHVPELDAFVAWKGGASVWLLTPPAVDGDWRTANWTWTRIDAGGVVPDNPVNGPYSKFQYIPSLGIAVIANQRSGPVYAIRLVDIP